MLDTLVLNISTFIRYDKRYGRSAVNRKDRKCAGGFEHDRGAKTETRYQLAAFFIITQSQGWDDS
jgi:hypothetical protein